MLRDESEPRPASPAGVAGSLELQSFQSAWLCDIQDTKRKSSTLPQAAEGWPHTSQEELLLGRTVLHSELKKKWLVFQYLYVLIKN